MTKREELLALAERVEAATGADRGLDGLIWGKVVASPPCSNPTALGYLSWPSYTASLDAAMTLVPEGATFMVDEGPAEWIVRGERPKRGRARIYILRRGWEDDGLSACDEEIGFGATPALALAAAALRARAAMEVE